MYSKHDKKSVHIYTYIILCIHTCIYVLQKKVRTKSGEIRSERDVEKERREREKMYTSKQLDPGSCPSLVSTIRSFVVLLIDTHSSSQFLKTVFSATSDHITITQFLSFLIISFSSFSLIFLFFNILVV